MPFGGGSSGGTSTVTQNASPWAGQQPFLTGGTSNGQTVPGVFPEAANLFQNYTPQYYPSSTVAPLTPLQNLGIESAANLGTQGAPVVNSADNFMSGLLGQGPNAGNPAAASLQGVANGNLLSAGNPYWQNQANLVSASVLPQIEGQFNSANRMGSPGAAYAASSGLGDALGNIAAQNYNTQTGNMISAASQLGNQFLTGRQQQVQGAEFGAPALGNFDYQNVGLLSNAGSQQQTQNQAATNGLVNQWDYYQNLPYQQLSNYAGAIGSPTGFGTTTTTPYYTNTAANLLGGGIGGASLGSSLFGTGGLLSGLGISQGMGTGILGLLGAGMGMFSDRRVKVVGEPYKSAVKDLEALTVKRARYKWDEPGDERPMLMADEVQQKFPKAVVGKPDDPISAQVLLPGELVAALVGAVKELAARLERIESRLAEAA